jgi:hypothetical protein
MDSILERIVLATFVAIYLVGFFHTWRKLAWQRYNEYQIKMRNYKSKIEKQTVINARITLLKATRQKYFDNNDYSPQGPNKELRKAYQVANEEIDSLRDNNPDIFHEWGTFRVIKAPKNQITREAAMTDTFPLAVLWPYRILLRTADTISKSLAVTLTRPPKNERERAELERRRQQEIDARLWIEQNEERILKEETYG